MVLVATKTAEVLLVVVNRVAQHACDIEQAECGVMTSTSPTRLVEGGDLAQRLSTKLRKPLQDAAQPELRLTCPRPGFGPAPARLGDRREVAKAPMVDLHLDGDEVTDDLFDAPLAGLDRTVSCCRGGRDQPLRCRAERSDESVP